MKEKDFEEQEQEFAPVGLEALYNIEYIIFELKSFLSGYSVVEIVQGKPKLKKIGEPLMNEKGIHSILSVFYSFCNPILSGTAKIDRAVSNALIENFADSIIRLMVINARHWDLKKGYFLTIFNKLLNAFVLVLSRSEGGTGLYLSHGMPPPEQVKKPIFSLPFKQEEYQEG